MITWLTTVDPQTQSSALVSINGVEPFFTPAAPVIETGYTSANFFSTVTRLGRTSPAEWSSVFGTSWNGTTEEEGTTTRGSRPVTTSTIRTISLYAETTTTNTIPLFYETTSQFFSGQNSFLGTAFSSTQTTRLTKQQTTIFSQILATTTNGESQYGFFFGESIPRATVYRAEETEVIWVADATNIEGQISDGPASDYATTFSEYTVYPQTETVAYSVVDQSEVPITNISFTNTLESGSFTYRDFSFFESATTVPYIFQGEIVGNLSQIPMETTFLDIFGVFSSTSYEFGNVVFPQDAGTAKYTKTRPQFGISHSYKELTSVNEFPYFTYELDRTDFSSTSREITAADTSYTTTRITSNIFGNNASYTATTSAGVSSFLEPSIFLNGLFVPTTRGRISRLVVGPVGALANEQIAFCYTGSGPTVYLLESPYASVRQGFVSIIPTALLAYDESYNFFGTISIDNLSATLTTLNSNNSSQSGTLTLSLGGFENPTTGILAIDSLKSFGVLNESQTVFEYINSGVYKNAAGETTRMDNEFNSYEGTSGNFAESWRTVSFFINNSTETISKIVWSSPKNSVDIPDPSTPSMVGF